MPLILAHARRSESRPPRADPDSAAVPLLAAADYCRFPGGRKKLTVLTRLAVEEFPTRPRVRRQLRKRFDLLPAGRAREVSAQTPIRHRSSHASSATRTSARLRVDHQGFRQ
jgi:hypothetical protein